VGGRGSRRGKPEGAPDPADTEPWSWSAVFAHIATSLGWTFEYSREHLTLHDLAALVKYWRRFPPAHVTLAALAKALAGRAGGPVRTSASTTGPASDTTAMELVASMLGPPVHKFRPPCRMQPPVQTPVQTPAPDPETP
jgi:hypothetical protein